MEGWRSEDGGRAYEEEGHVTIMHNYVMFNLLQLMSSRSTLQEMYMYMQYVYGCLKNMCMYIDEQLCQLA